jgi:ATP-dependent helicase/nuclease subunit A
MTQAPQSDICPPVDSTLLDKAARIEALDPRQSFAVSAPAGSGKTGLLTQRVLKLLALCDYPEEVLGITFTRKAAQEMHHRITTALQQANDNRPANSKHEQLTLELARQVLARDREKGWQLLLSPSRLRIQTIDAFCQSLTRQLPVAAGASAYLETRENASGLYKAAVRNLFQELRNEGPLAQALATLLRHMDNNVAKVESLLVQLLRDRTQWLAPLYYSQGSKHDFDAALRTIIADTLATAADNVAHCLDELEHLLSFAVNNRLDNGEASPFAAEDVNLRDLDGESKLALTLWQAVVELCLTKEGNWRKANGINIKCGFPPASAAKNPEDKTLFSEKKAHLADLLEAFAGEPELLGLFTDIRALPNLSVEMNQWRLLESLTVLLPSLAALFHLHCRSVGQADFNEVAIAAARALGDEEAPSTIALKLDYQIKHILVDEFQDTSLPQLQLLQKLTAGWQPGDGRTLFIVGDAMQSCYGFRNANVGIFIQSREQGIGTVPLKPLNLRVNFRSDGKLVDWVNGNFQQIFPERDNINRGAVCYSPAHPCARDSEAGKDSIIEARGFVDAGEGAQAKYLVQLLKQELEDSTAGSIAILARSRAHLQDILRELRLANIDWQARDIDALRDRMAVIDLLSLTRALLNFSDRIAWLAVLRAPWCGIDLHDLHTLANQVLEENPCVGRSGYPLLWGQILHCEKLDLSADGQQRVQTLRAVLRPAIAHKARKPLRQWIEGVWLALGGPAAVCNPAEIHSPEHFLDLLDQHTRGADIDDWEEFETALANLYDKSEKNTRLQVMTIHKSKGLEFDTVIIPKLDKGTRGDDNPLLLWQEYTDRSGQTHLLISPLGAVGEDADSLYAYLKRERTLRQQHEAARLLYVACTRAISRLYLLIDLQRDEKTGDVKPPGKNTLAGHLWETVKDEIILVEDTAEDGTAPAFTQTQILRLSADWQAPSWPRDDTLSAYRGQVIFAGDNRPDPAPLLNRHARYLGTVLHRALQYLTVNDCVTRNDRIEGNRSEDWFARQYPFWVQQLRQLGMPNDQATLAAEQVATGLRNTLADPIGRWLLDNRHENSRCELSLTSADAGYRESIIDRTFIDQGVRWIVDYKTGEGPANQEPSEFLFQAEATYGSQLSEYAKLMRKLDRQHGRELPVKTALYFPLLTIFHEI